MFSIIPPRCRAVTHSTENRRGLDVPPDAAGGSDPAWRGDAFSKGVYIANNARELGHAVGAKPDRFTRGKVEALYPLYRLPLLDEPEH